MHFQRGNADKPLISRREDLSGFCGGSMCDLFFFQVLKFHREIAGFFLLGVMEMFLNQNTAATI